MTAEELDVFYAREYRQVYQGDEGPTPSDLKIQDERAAALLEFIRGAVSEVNNHLDVGCSSGILLKTFRSHYNCRIIGVEPGDTYRKYAQSQGLTVYPDLAEVKTAGGERFDLISMAHVLEHIPDPKTYLTELREQHSARGGYLLIEVPNLYSHDSFEVAHMSSFSEHTLGETLNKSGYIVTATMKHGLPRSKLVPLYLTVLAQTYSAEIRPYVKPEKRVRIKRKMGIFSRRIIQRIFPKKAWIPMNSKGNQ
jgi:SAM-dependent methyltransferase